MPFTISNERQLLNSVHIDTKGVQENPNWQVPLLCSYVPFCVSPASSCTPYVYIRILSMLLLYPSVPIYNLSASLLYPSLLFLHLTMPLLYLSTPLLHL